MKLLRYLGVLLFNMLINFWGSMPAWFLLVMHFVFGWRLLWFWLALGAWIGGIMLYMFIIGRLSRYGTGEDRQNANINPYSNKKERF